MQAVTSISSDIWRMPGSAFVARFKNQAGDDTPGRVAGALAVFLDARSPRNPHQLSGDGTAVGIQSEQELGLALSWIFVNRPTNVTAILSSTTPSSCDSITFAPPRVPVPVANRPTHDTDPSACIEIFHLHCHFDATNEPAALKLLDRTKAQLQETGNTSCHSHVWHEKNGPHDGWSWELWVDNPTALGVAVHFLMRQRCLPENASLYCPFHCDTDQEYTDHSARLAFIGPPDDLDLEFFQPPDARKYNGPVGPRRTNDNVIYSMGEFYERATLASKYRAQDRGSDAHGHETGGKLPTMPSLFLPHGSPPIPIERCACETWLQQAAAQLPCRPKAIVFMSPHFFSPEWAFEVSTAERPHTKYDFDSDTNPIALEKLKKLKYPCPGAPDVARKVARLLNDAGLRCDENEEQGLDHGVWTPLYVMFPHADVPVTSLSVRVDLDTESHLAAGRALRPLLDEGVLIVGSGEVVHNVPNMGARSSPQQPWCLTFEGWMEAKAGLATELVSKSTGATTVANLRQLPSRPHAPDDQALLNWKTQAPYADIAHPENGSPGEHLMPWFFAYGASGANATVRCLFKEYLGSLPMVAYSFEPSNGLSIEDADDANRSNSTPKQRTHGLAAAATSAQRTAPFLRSNL